MNKYLRDILRAAEKEGVQGARIDTTGAKKHSMLVGTYRGQPFKMIVCRGSGHREITRVNDWVKRAARRAEANAQLRVAEASKRA